jgi:hypothetical protein
MMTPFVLCAAVRVQHFWLAQQNRLLQPSILGPQLFGTIMFAVGSRVST